MMDPKVGLGSRLALKPVPYAGQYSLIDESSMGGLWEGPSAGGQMSHAEGDTREIPQRSKDFPFCQESQLSLNTLGLGQSINHLLNLPKP